MSYSYTLRRAGFRCFAALSFIGCRNSLCIFSHFSLDSISHILTLYVGGVWRFVALVLDRISEFPLILITFCSVFYFLHSDTLCGRLRQVASLVFDRISEFSVNLITFYSVFYFLHFDTLCRRASACCFSCPWQDVGICYVFFISHSDTLHWRFFSISRSDDIRRKGTTCHCSYDW